jgi:hypothetical protein
VGNENREQRGHTSGYMAYCEFSHEEGWTKGTKVIHGSLGFKYKPLEKTTMIADCSENQFTLHDFV